MSEQENETADNLHCPHCGRRHEFHFVCKPYIDSTLTPDPGSLIRGIVCEKHDLVSATIACTCCMEELCKERDEAKAQLRPFQKVPKQVKEVLDCADVDTHHPDIGAAERKPMMLHERVAALVKERNEALKERDKLIAYRIESRRLNREVLILRHELSKERDNALKERDALRAERDAETDWLSEYLDVAILHATVELRHLRRENDRLREFIAAMPAPPLSRHFEGGQA